MTPAEAEEYTQSLGQIFSGSWRQILWAERQGIPATLGLSIEEWVTSRLGGYVRLGVEERREAARELTAPPAEGGQGMKKKEAAAVLGVSAQTVGRDLKPESVSEPVTNVSEQHEPELGQLRTHSESLTNVSEPEQQDEASEAVQDWVESDSEYQKAEYLAQFTKTLRRSDDFLEFDADRIAALADQATVNIISNHQERVKQFLDKIRKARTGLRVVGGL